MRLVVDPNGEHNEAFWRKEFGDAVLWLYDAVSSTAPQPIVMDLIKKVYPNPGLDTVFIEFGGTSNYQVRLYDPTGKLVMSRYMSEIGKLDISDLPRGLYTLQVNEGDRVKHEAAAGAITLP